MAAAVYHPVIKIFVVILYLNAAVKFKFTIDFQTMLEGGTLKCLRVKYIKG
jgi:hypothetical protein